MPRFFLSFKFLFIRGVPQGAALSCLSNRKLKSKNKENHNQIQQIRQYSIKSHQKIIPGFLSQHHPTP